MSEIPFALYQTLLDLPSTSGQEDQVRAYLAQRQAQLGLICQTDATGNLIALLPGEGRPIGANVSEKSLHQQRKKLERPFSVPVTRAPLT